MNEIKATMVLRNETILITGGSSGIGFELARQLTDLGNTVIICGRSVERLAETKRRIPSVHTFQCDIAIEKERQALVEYVNKHHPSCNVLVNNAAIVHKTSFAEDKAIVTKAQLEVQTNFLAPVALCKAFLPRFEERQTSAIINITTGLVYAPRAVYPIYNATKAALHAFTQVLRIQLKRSPIGVVEVMMPVVATPWHKGDVPKIAISPEKAVSEMIRKIEIGKQEVRVGAVRILYWLSRMAPAFALKKINGVK